MIVLALLMMVQQTDSTRARLQARGLPADLAAQVTVVAQQTAGQGLPAQAIVDKAVEGFYKHVPPSRIEAAVRDLSQRLGRARAELRSGGVADASGGVIAGSADASAQGIARGDQVAMIHAAPDDESAASGLSVAAALVVQGIDPRTSAQLVTSSFAHGRTLAQVLDLPAAARALQVRGTSTTEVGRQLLDGISAAGTVTGRTGVTARPVVPPVRVP